MSEEEAKTNIPSVVVDALKGTNADIYNDIYMAGGIADNNRYFVVFNSYYLDKETNKNNVQYFCLVSKDNKPTDLQKAVIKFFNGTSAKNLLKKGSSDNPFEKIGEIVNVSADESVLGEDGLIEPEKLSAITYDPVRHTYIKLGEKVGNAFSDGKKLI